MKTVEMVIRQKRSRLEGSRLFSDIEDGKSGYKLFYFRKTWRNWKRFDYSGTGKRMKFFDMRNKGYRFLSFSCFLHKYSDGITEIRWISTYQNIHNLISTKFIKPDSQLKEKKSLFCY